MDKSSRSSSEQYRSEIQTLFENIGGEFLWTNKRILEKLGKVKFLIFDWDGVFSDGRKDKNKISTYSELDTMGINMLRFGFFILTHRVLPVLIVTGEENPVAWNIAERDHFSGIYFGIKNKSEVDLRIKKDLNLDVSDAIFFFDDILDFALLRKCLMGIALSNPAMPLLQKLIRRENQCAYITHNGGNGHGIRESCELILGLMNVYDETMENRTLFSPLYQEFLKERNTLIPALF